MTIQWFLVVAIVVILAQGYIFGKLAGRSMKVERFFSQRACFPGDEVEMVERISNEKLMPIPWLRLESLVHANLRFQNQPNLAISEGSMFQNHRSLFSMLPYTRINRRPRITCLKRGCYRLNTATLTLGDALGVHKSSVQLSLFAELLVYPEPAKLEELELPHYSWLGDYTVRRWIMEDPFMIAGVREYRYGDTLSGINWKATARNGRLQVYQRDYTAEHKLIIYVNVEDHEKMWDQVNDEELIERGISLAAGFAKLALDRGVETGFASNGHTVDDPKEPIRVEPRNGAGQMELLLESMARLVVERSVPFDVLLEQETDRGLSGCDLLIISAYRGEKMEAPIERLRRGGNAVELCLLDLGTEQGDADDGRGRRSRRRQDTEAGA
jgi:uncharacterized protein (DUF58 family)